MSEQNTNSIKIMPMEEAWKAATDEGYEGTLEEFTALCDQIADKLNLDEKLNMDEMESVAGGGFVEAMEATGEWIQDNARTFGLSVAALVSAVGGIVYCTTAAKKYAETHNPPHGFLYM